MWTILLIILIVMLLGGLPTWGYHTYGYAPSGVIVVVLVIVLVVWLMQGRL